MSPRIEKSRRTEESPIVNYFTIDLSDPAVFDPNRFDELAKSTSYDENREISLLKYLVVGDRMFVFPDKVIHLDFFKLLSRRGDQGSLQSAGRIDVFWWRPEGPGRRSISDFSYTLMDKNYLNISDSEAYKESRIADCLGDFFSIGR